MMKALSAEPPKLLLSWPSAIDGATITPFSLTPTIVSALATSRFATNTSRIDVNRAAGARRG